MPESEGSDRKHIAALGLGSNVGDRLEHIRYALAALSGDEETRVLRASSVYQTEAHVLREGDQQAAYLNAVCLVETRRSPTTLLSLCLGIEAERGRERTADTRWQPRTLDIDVLLINGLTIEGPELTVPHPRIPERRFVLVPLFEIAPDLEIPSPINRSVQYLLEHCPDATSVVLYRDRPLDTTTA